MAVELIVKICIMLMHQMAPKLYVCHMYLILNQAFPYSHNFSSILC